MLAALSSARRLRRRSDLLLRCLLSSSAAAAAPPPLSATAAKSRLRREFDPDRAVSLLASIPNPASNPASARYALDLAARRLARSRRFADAAALLDARRDPASFPVAATESYLATLIVSYGSASLPDGALAAFRDVPRLTSRPPTAVSFNALLSAFVRCGRHRRVPELFDELSKEHAIAPDSVSYGILLKALCLSRKSDEAFEVFEKMHGKGVERTTVMYTTLLDSLYKEGKPEEAEKLWKEMVGNGCIPDQSTYNVKVTNFALHGQPEEVLEVIQEMKAAGVKPDTITYNFLLTCYCKNGRLEDAKELYKGLGLKGCLPNAATYKYFLAQLCENGDFDAGLGVFRDSLKRNKVPDFRTMRLLVLGLAKEGKTDEAKWVIGEVKNKFPDNLVIGWKKVERELGMSPDEEESHQGEAA